MTAIKLLFIFTNQDLTKHSYRTFNVHYSETDRLTTGSALQLTSLDTQPMLRVSVRPRTHAQALEAICVGFLRVLVMLTECSVPPGTSTSAPGEPGTVSVSEIGFSSLFFFFWGGSLFVTPVKGMCLFSVILGISSSQSSC